MGDIDRTWPLPGRLMLATGFVGFGLAGLVFGSSIDGIPSGAPWRWVNGGGWILLSVLTVSPDPVRRHGYWLAFFPGGWGVFVMLSVIARGAGTAAWVPALELVGMAAALEALGRPGRDPIGRRGPRALVGAMLILFGLVHWMYVGAIAGMIPEWMPGRAAWPWVTGAANLAAGLALISDVVPRLASALVGAMFASWIGLVHLPRLIAAPRDGNEWIACAMAFALTGVVWTIHGAMTRSDEDLQSSVR